MQELTKYILEHINDLNVEEISTFKPNMIKSSKLLEILKSFNDINNKFDTILFKEYISGQINDIKYLYSDNDVFTFEKTNDSKKTNLKLFIKDLRNCKNGIAQFALPTLDNDLYLIIYPKDNEIWIVFSKENNIKEI